MTLTGGKNLEIKKDITIVEKFDNILETMPNIGQYVEKKKKRRFSF